MLDLKKHLLTRILSCALAFTILFSDISAYAASDMQQGETEFEEQIPEEVLPAEEAEAVEELSTQEVFEEESILEDEQEPEPKPAIEVDIEDVYYLVPETETSAMAMSMYALSDGNVSLKDSNEENWIDRLDLTDAAEIRAFYDTLVEASDNDGENDFLIDDAYLGADYNLEIIEVKQTVKVNLSNAADETVVNNEIQAAVSEAAGSVAAKYDPYIIAARDAFDRD